MKFFDGIDRYKEIYSEEMKGRRVALYDYLDPETEQVNRVKIWEIKKEKFEILRDIWLHEIRQLLRIQNYPKANNYLELLKNANYDENGFYIFYNNAESTRILSDYLKHHVNEQSNDIRKISLRKHWLHSSSLKKLENRIIFWKNILRIAKAIQILHDQGIIHRNINLNSIVYNEALNKNESECFKLTGFEWSLYLNQLSNKEFNGLKEDLYPFATFKADWISLGFLICKLLSINIEEIDSSYLLIKEKNLINILVHNKNIKKYENNEINLEKFENRLSLVLKDLMSFYENKNTNNPAILVVKTDENGKVLPLIKNYLNKNYDIDPNLEEKINFIKDDLNVKNVIMYKCNNKRNLFYLLIGKKLVYQVAEFIVYENNIPVPTSDYLFIQNIFEEIPSFAGYNKIEFSLNINIEISNNFYKRKNHINNFSSWIPIIELFKEKEVYSKEFLELYQGLLFIYAVEVSLYKSNLFQVDAKILTRSNVENNEYELISVKLIEDNINKRISKNLMLDGLQRRFEKLNLDTKENKWILRKNKKNNVVDEDSRSIEIIFDHIDYKNRYYVFKTKKNYDLKNSLSDNMTVILSSGEGSKASLKRKNKALYRLLDQQLLTKSIIDPIGTYKKFKYTSDYHNSFNDLDDAKKKVFTSIMETEPNFVVQGPPGVGKSFLVTTLIRQIFKDESFSKVLFTAQSHSTVNVLYNEISKNEFSGDPIIIDAFDNKNIEAINEDKKIIERVTNRFINNFSESQMYKDIKEKYSKNLIDQLEDFMGEGGQRLSFFEQIIKSANMLFTTSNSKIVEDLIENNIQFDYTILEEAGKSTGLELISPLMLSHKRLLIGDHKQLPPFLENTIKKIINSANVDYGQIINEIKEGEFRFHLFNQLSLDVFSIGDREVTKEKFNESIRNLIQSINNSFSLFKYLALKAQELNDRNHESFGQIINQQHRMHPDIGSLVSKTIYDAKLLNHKSTIKNYLDPINEPFIFKHSSKLDLTSTRKGIIWIDIEHKNNSKTLQGEFDVGYVNEQEVSVIEHLLTLLERNYENTKNIDESLTIQILSPYAKQADYISNKINLNSIPGGFKLKSNDKLCKTVDSFQGNEADLIIVSLVRHNSSTSIESSLGFLLDQRRMNVLLSRGKYKLIIVGSFGMFTNWAKHIPENITEIEVQINNDINHEDKKFIKLFSNILSAHPPAYCDFISTDKFFIENK